ncbi:hypothetical protein KFE25_002545 [Diacronema lutheri]|uniref:Uncharacterized protein n=1 Tax=Diacronema lutheri TaxID=2081491 RepID=A0A8J5X4G5_DIALT|nr:hypothetical protein KFE25_002545 [Diacronema lutheri]
MLMLVNLALAFVQPHAAAVGRAGSSHVVTARSARSCVEMARGKPPAFMDPSRQGGRAGGPMPMPEDGIPAFMLYVRAPSIGMWYPVSMLKGDKPTRALVDAIANNGIGAEMARAQVNEGLAKSVFAPVQLKQLTDGVLKQYKVLKDSRDSLQWGYKIQDKYLQDKIKEGALPEPKITILTVEMTADRVDQAKSAVSKTLDNVWKAVTGSGKVDKPAEEK